MFESALERKRNHERLLAALKDAQDANNAKTYFLASMSHEIRTPLNAVIGFSELLKDGNVDLSTQRDYLNSISYSSNALLRLINDVLDLSKLETGKMIFNLEKTDFKNLANEIFGILRQKIEEKNLNGVISVGAMPMVFIDNLRVRQILFNLLGNSVKFTNTGSIFLGASFKKTDKSKGKLTIIVKDTGVGINKEDQKNVFEAFVQSKDTRGTLATKGTGLGLAIVKRLIEKMNGTITLQSEYLKGSTFTVVLNDVEFFERQNGEGGDSDLIDDSIFKNMRALLVDDISMNLKVLQALLSKLGVQSVCAQSAVDAMGIAQTSKFDVILTDLWMPEINGAQLAENLRRELKIETPIIAITADMESRVNFNMANFEKIITKPITVAKLREVLKSIAPVA